MWKQMNVAKNVFLTCLIKFFGKKCIAACASIKRSKRV